jgi:citrate lyase beta subunit
MDFVSAHRGAIPASAMGAKGQFEHPLVLRAKLEIAAACQAHNKTPSHCVVTEFKHASALMESAGKAARQFGYTRMWSIHPAQIRPIVEAFTPTVAEVDLAIEILGAAQAAGWAPIQHRDTLHDRMPVARNCRPKCARPTSTLRALCACNCARAAAPDRQLQRLATSPPPGQHKMPRDITYRRLL